MQLDYALDILSKDWTATGRERSREETEVPSLTICANKRCALQKRILATVPKVFKPRGSGLRNERSSRGYLWKPLRGTVISAQDDPSWVLLANYAERCTSLRQDLRQVLEVQQFHQTTIRRANTHDSPLAIRSMGTRYHGSLPNRGQATEVPSSWYRLLYQVNGSGSPSHYHGEEHSKLCLEKHNLQIQDTQNTCL